MSGDESSTLDKSQCKKILEILEPEIFGFLGGSRVVASTYEKKITLKEKFPGNGGSESITENECVGYVALADGDFVFVRYTRLTISFSKFEINFLHELFQTITRLGSSSNPAKHQAHFRTSIISSSFDIAIARFLRGEVKHFWSVQRVLQLIKSVTYKRYEGSPCTSSILYTNSGPETIKNLEKYYVIHKPKKIINESPHFFDSILTYRYIDGMRSSFIFDNSLKCLGVLEISSKNFTGVDFNVHKPFVDPLKYCSGKSFFMFATKKQSVDILSNKKQVIRWRAGKWGHIDYKQLYHYISKHISGTNSIELLADVIVSLSNSGHGAIILLPSNSNWSKSVSRHVDDSEIGNFLRLTRLGRHMKELNDIGTLIPMLSSDGMTVIDENGVVIDSSALIKIDKEIIGLGGGRTSAAISASRFGTVFKVSEDGPIQIYINEEPQLELI